MTGGYRKGPRERS